MERREELSAILSTADGFILIIDAEPSNAERFEWGLALQAWWAEQSKRIVPIAIGGVELPPFLRDMPGVHAGSSEEPETNLFPRVLQLLNEGAEQHDGAESTGHSQLLERLDVAIAALSQEEMDADQLSDHRQMLERAASEASDPKSQAMSHLSIGLIDLQLNDPHGALTHLETAHSICRTTGAPEYPSLLSVLIPLSHALTEIDDFDGAADALCEAVEIRKRYEGVESPGVVAASQELGVLLIRTGRDREAKEVLEHTLDINRRELGPGHPRVGANEHWLAVAYERLGDLTHAKQLYESAASTSGDPKSADPGRQVKHLLGLGRMLTELGDLEAAKGVLSRAWQLAGSLLGDNLSITAACAFAYGMTLLRGGDCDGAINALTESVKANEAAGVFDDRNTATYFIGIALRQDGQLDRAHEVLMETLGTFEKSYGQRSRRVAENLFNLGLVARDRGDLAFARQCLERAAAIGGETVGHSDPRVLKYHRALGRLDLSASTE